MLTEKERKEMLEMANSKKLREDFRILSKKTYSERSENINVDLYLKFLSSFNKICKQKSKNTFGKTKPAECKNMKL